MRGGKNVKTHRLRPVDEQEMPPCPGNVGLIRWWKFWREERRLERAYPPPMWGPAPCAYTNAHCDKRDVEERRAARACAGAEGHLWHAAPRSGACRTCRGGPGEREFVGSGRHRSVARRSGGTPRPPLLALASVVRAAAVGVPARAAPCAGPRAILGAEIPTIIGPAAWCVRVLGVQQLLRCPVIRRRRRSVVAALRMPVVVVRVCVRVRVDICGPRR